MNNCLYVLYNEKNNTFLAIDYHPNGIWASEGQPYVADSIYWARKAYSPDTLGKWYYRTLEQKFPGYEIRKLGLLPKEK